MTSFLKRLLLPVFPLLAVFCCLPPAFGQDMVPGGPVPLVLDPTISTFRVEPRTHPLVIRPMAATITVNFVPDGSQNAFKDNCITWPVDSQAAFLYAVSLWEPYLTSPVQIVIEACWTSLGAGILGHGGSLGFWYNFSGAPHSNTFYPVALANAFHGSDLDPAEADISVAFNSNFSPSLQWYFGMDGNPPVNSYDFVSVVMHEITHGLGFLGNMTVAGGLGQWGWGFGIPTDYDRFTVKNKTLKQSLINTSLFPNSSVALANALQSSDVYFNGVNAISANGGVDPPKLYAPATWQSGSSYAHLDEIYNGTVNALMTYSLSNSESIHDPGPVTLGILKDIGWTMSTSCTYSLSSSGSSFGPTGGSGSFDVNTDVGCAWTATESLDWVTITSGASGSGHGTVSYTVNSYSGIEAQSGNINAAGKSFVITQTGVSPTANFSASLSSGNVPFQVAFTDSSSNATSWLWEFGDGETSALENPTHTYQTTTGSPFTVRLTATNINGSDMMTQTVSVSSCANGPVRYSGTSYPVDGKIGTAYSVAAMVDELDIQAIDFIIGSLTFGENKDITLRGGYDCSYAPTRIPDTVIEGSLTISGGTITFDAIVIR